ncbi:MAG TPA: flagellar basal body rod C-terminal domain-containing protein, partial [Spirochaetota bacterium]|nr:flagellar basal body rod C-terminal domain-containing protein [Spirochaetota bacterium]
IAAAIARLNNQIVKSEAMGDNPNDVLDKRDALIEKLSSIINVKTTYKDNDEVMVFIDAKMLVQGDKYSPLKTIDNKDNEGFVDLYWKESNDRVTLRAGKLAAYFETRDNDLKNQIRNLDAIANNVVFTTNRIHQEGFDNYGIKAGKFFVEKYRGTNPFGNFDRRLDNRNDSSYLYQVAGSNRINGEDIMGEAGTITLSSVNGDADINIDYTADQRIKDVLKKINLSDSNVNAYIDADNYLVFKARSANNSQSFVIKHLEDSGNFLSGVAGLLKASGAAGAYDYTRTDEYSKINGEMTRVDRAPERHAAGWIAVDDFIKKDVNRIAAADGTDYDGVNGNDRSLGSGDGSIAQAISDLRFARIRIDEKPTFNEYYTSMIDDIGSKNYHAGMEIEKHEALLGNLKKTRESISGVNIDEEMAEMIAMQHGYQAGARIVTAMDRMLDTIINRMGVV